MSASDADQSSVSDVANTERSSAADSVPALDNVVTPVKTASCTYMSRVESPNVFTGYPVLPLPSGAGSPYGRSSPRNSSLKLHSPATLSHRQLSSSKTPLKGQCCIDQVFTPISSPAAPSPQAELVPVSSLLTVSGQNLSSKIQPCSVLLGRKWTRPDEIFVSPLLSRNREHFATMTASKDLLSADVSAVDVSKSEHSCNSAITQQDNCSLDAVANAEASPVSQSVPTDAIEETSAVKNAQVTVSLALLKNSTVASVVSSAGCSNDTVSQKSSPQKTDVVQPVLKIPAVKLQRMQKVLEKSMLARTKAAEMSLSNDVTSEASVLSPPSVATTEVNSGSTNCNAVSASAHATANQVDNAASNVVSLPAIGSKLSEAIACQPVESSHINQQTVSSHNVQCDVIETAVKMDVLAAGDSEVNAAAACKHFDSSSGGQQIVPISSAKTSSVSAADEAEPKHLTSQLDSGDNQTDVDTHVAAESDEFLCAKAGSMLSV